MPQLVPQDGDSDEFITDLKTNLVIILQILGHLHVKIHSPWFRTLYLIKERFIICTVGRKHSSVRTHLKTWRPNQSRERILFQLQIPQRKNFSASRGRWHTNRLTLPLQAGIINCVYKMCFQVLRQRTYHDCLLYELLTVFTHVL